MPASRKADPVSSLPDSLRPLFSTDFTSGWDVRLALTFVVLGLHARRQVRCEDVPDRIETLVREAWPDRLGISQLPATSQGTNESLCFAKALLRVLPGLASPAVLAYLPSRLFQAVVSSSQRKHHGEFYTPRWLVELALQRVGWPCESVTLTDPTCGAGAFLAGAALALRQHPGPLSDAAKRLSGADINPLAVLGASVACLCAIADRLEPGEPFEPDIRVADLLDSPPAAASDLVVGNPPWLRFSRLDPATQARVAEAARHYDLVPASSFHGGSELDVSAVFAYRMLDTHLTRGGRAALVMPSSLLRSASSARFRRFVLPEGTALGLDHVTDFGAMRVFSGAGATNRAALLRWTKGNSSGRELEAAAFDTVKSPEGDASWSGIRAQLRPRPCVARRLGSDGRIALLPPGMPVAALEGATEGKRGRKGVTTDLNGAYFVRVLGPGSAPHLLRVVNDVTTRGKPVPVHSFEVEEALLFPLLKGAKQIRAFVIDEPRVAVVVPNRRVNGMMDEPTFRESFPAAHAHFAWVEQQTGALSKRSTYRRMLVPRRAPFFNVYNVGDYTFAPCKVVWAEIARTLVAGLAGLSFLSPGSEAKVVVPDHKVYFAAFDELPPAQFLCALLNSTLVGTYLDAVTEKLQVGALLDRVRLPAFDSNDPRHQHLVALAAQAAAGFDAGMQERIDKAVIEVMA